MSQFNYQIKDISRALTAVITLNSGGSEPSTTYPFMLWMDTSVTPAVLKQRTEADDAWIEILKADNIPFDDGQTQINAETVQQAIEKIKQLIDAHAARTDNPHQVTAEQSGAYTKAEVDALLKKAGAAPIGSVTALASSVISEGWLACDGAEVSRTDYADLFGVLGETFGVGDGSTTFNLPDLRGEFIRGLDSGRGVDAARELGSQQDYAMEDHNHKMRLVQKSGSGSGCAGNASFDAYSSETVQSTGLSGSPYNVASETRPRNVALTYIIKY
ncbi:tail fiber protein [Salidesulfovibrio onnuriiensis]|uniref:tail fiber protein n=1 Tax=Salidesulfovibrio onnuriiensis TaxID=2583823 RepID=UPI0011CB8A3D|nr:tail fiber protein [Salidesulfovibrio onnuriiensis]